MTTLSDLIARLEADPHERAGWCANCGYLRLGDEILIHGACDLSVTLGAAWQAVAALKAREALR